MFRTYEPSRDRLVAVKVFRLDIVPEQAQALAEALNRAAQASLFHPSIVEPISAGIEGTLAYRAEEYVAAESLDVAMRHYAPAPIDKGLPFITQLAGAIDFARAAGVSHGALHPRDIFVTPDEARATGFGVVEALEAVGIRAPIRRPYTAPERIDGAPWGIAADVFSLAAIAFELLTGRRPAGTGTGIGSLPDGAHRDALHAVLARAMDADPSKRHPSALAFASALESASRGEAVEAPALGTAAALGVSAVEPMTPVATTASAPSPGEFTIEQRLDPIAAAIAHEAVDARDEGPEPPPIAAALPIVAARPSDAADLDADAHGDADRAVPGDDIRFADDFIEEQADPEIRRPLEAVGETVPPFARDVETPGYGAASAVPFREPAVEEPMLGAEFEPDPRDAERARPRILPYAVVGILCLLAGFAAGEFMANRTGTASPTDAAPPATAAAPAPTTQGPAAPGPATADKPGQYSEHKVTPPAPVRETAAPPTEGVRSAPRAAAGAPAPPARSESTTRSTRAATTGRLVVQSTPSKAAVTINGTWRGRTPLTLDDLAFGTYTVRVVQPGYRIAREDFTLNARVASHSFSARLEPEPRPAAPVPASPAPRPAAPAAAPSASAGAETFTGSIFVDSRPRGATVLVDGRSVGQTPLSLPGVPIGSHVVKIEMEGKKPWSATTRVTAGAMSRVTGSLEDK